MSVEVAALVDRALAGGGPDAEGDGHDATRARVLDAALALAAEGGLRAVTMDAVAARAGVGRMTVYRRFGERARVIDALAVRECRRVLAALADAVAGSATVEDEMAEGFAAALRLAREHPLLGRLARTDPAGVLAGFLADDGRVLDLARAFIAARIVAGRERAGAPADPAAAAAVADVLVRFGASFVLLPGGPVATAGEAEARAFARRHLAPLVAG